MRILHILDHSIPLRSGYTFRTLLIPKQQWALGWETEHITGAKHTENFAAYGRYRWHSYEERMRQLLPLSVRRPLFGMLGRAYPKADWVSKVLRVKTTFEAMARDTLEGYFHGVSVMGDGLRDYSASLWSLLMFSAFLANQGRNAAA
jgi:hypothetical protein